MNTHSTHTEIKYFLESSNAFEPQPDAHGRRYYLLRDGKKVAYLSFKWAFGGWVIWLYDNPDERIKIDSIEHLKRICKL